MRVWVTGIGAVSCAGDTCDEIWGSTLHERTGVKEGLGRISGNDPGKPTDLAVRAARQAMLQAGWNELNPSDGLILATTTGQVTAWDKPLVAFLAGTLSREEFERAFRHQPLGALLEDLATELAFKGRTQLITTACSAATQALALGALWIKQGRVKRCLVGGVEVLCELTIQGFKSLNLLAAEAARPFDVARSGINLSEGGAFLCLESGEPRAPLAALAGYGMATDGFHMTAPHPEGRGCFDAMSAALGSAGLSPTDISWIHAHGTGSKHNDAAESQAIERLFGSAVVGPWVSSTKWVHGHALGASGALESILCVNAIRHQTIPRTGGLLSPDPALSLKHPVNALQTTVTHVLKNTLGFGGANAALVFSRPQGDSA